MPRLFLMFLTALLFTGVDVAHAQSLLHIAQRGDIRAARRYLDRGGNANEANQNGVTAVFVAAENGHADFIRFLAANGANVNKKAFQNQAPLTPLIAAAQKGHSAAILALLDAGADIEATSSHGLTALHAAAYYGHMASVRALVARGANRNALFRETLTPAALAQSQGHTEVLNFLQTSR